MLEIFFQLKNFLEASPRAEVRIYTLDLNFLFKSAISTSYSAQICWINQTNIV